MYKYLALVEKPLEKQLDQIMAYRKVLQMLELERQIVTEQLESKHALNEQTKAFATAQKSAASAGSKYEDN